MRNRTFTTVCLVAFGLAIFAIPKRHQAYAIDGDTLVTSDGTKWRLNGVDAPELHDELGIPAKNRLQSMITGQKVSCRAQGGHTYDRTAGVWWTQEVSDLGKAMVVQGYALDCAKYSGGRYARFETINARVRQRRATYCEVR